MIQIVEPQSMVVPSGSWQLDVEAGMQDVTESASSEKSASVSVKPEQQSSPTPPSLKQIVESLLFAATEPLEAERICSIIRNLTLPDLDQTIRELNQYYQRVAKPYTISQQQHGYRLSLRPRYRQHLEKLYGGMKEARFSQPAIETLAVVAYRQPLNQAGIEAIQGQDCSAALRQLIRRGMVQIAGHDQEQMPLYGTTRRFLDFFQLTKPDDLPRADDLERL